MRGKIKGNILVFLDSTVQLQAPNFYSLYPMVEINSDRREKKPF